MSKKVIIIGAGPGGLAAGMLLANKGLEVIIHEKEAIVGGRNGCLEKDGYTFDIGPTFFLMKDVLEDIFSMTGRKLADYAAIAEVEPMYRLRYNERDNFYPARDLGKMEKEMERMYPGSFKHYLRYLKKERKKYDKLIPCLKVPYSSMWDLVRWRLIKALPFLDVHRSLFSRLGKFFKNEQLRLAFTFQAKYIGMSPWKAPGLFSIISFIEHGDGIFHVKGGLNKLSAGMARAFAEDGGTLRLSSPVRRVVTEGRRAVGVELADGTVERADYVIINPDFAHAMTTLVEEKKRKKYSDKKLAKKLYSCSTFMLYLGINKRYTHGAHHNILFAGDYRQNVKEISETYELSLDPSVYVQNASLMDDSLAPAGKSTLYVLAPIANNNSGIDWELEKAAYREKILDILETRGGYTGLRDHIETELMITPKDWEERYGVYKGATFNLGHNLGQMLMFRPHNRFECLKDCYLVGGGTHPGSGLPTIYESGRISAEMILKKNGIRL